jgi:flagellar protein FliO/FliZ
MKSAVFVVAACCIVGAAAALAAEAAPAVATAPAPTLAPAAEPAAAPTLPATQPGVAAPALRAPVAPAPSASALPASASAGSLLQTILALSFVLALLAALAWAMKRYGPRAGGSNATLRLVGSLSLGGRERIIVIEVADQWIVVGAAPGRVNALATIARPPEHPNATSSGAASITEGANSATFADWLKQTIDKRHGK